MPKDDRREIISELEAELKMPVLAYVLGDRPNLHTMIAADQLPRFPRHLAAIGDRRSIALLIYTRGGDTNMAWPIINFIRAYARKVVALVPFFAHSTGTLICLGADITYMSKLATLSPIDPSVANAFNPQDPANPQNRLPIAVEDVMAYLELAKAHGVKRDEDFAAVYRRLAESVHPLALGNVHRSIEMIKQLAEKLIRLHSSASDEEIRERIKRLTTEFYTHSHMISRSEAIDLGLPVKAPPKRVDDLLVSYYSRLVEDLQINDPFNPAKLVAGLLSTAGQTPPPPTTHRFERALIETATTSDIFVTEGRISMQPQMPPGLQMPTGMPPGMGLPPGMQPQQPALPAAATLEILREEWEQAD